MLAAIRIAALGTLGYITPRVLVGFGVPLDEWAITLGTWLGAPQPWLEEWGLMIVAAGCAIVLSGIEAWWRPAQRIWTKISKRERRIPDTLVPLSDDDCREWSKVDPLALWQAASLWAELRPHLDIVRFDSATGYARFSMLLRAVETNTLQVVEKHDDTKYCHVAREELKRYAETIGERPKFLFHPSIVKAKKNDEEYIDLNEAALRAYEETQETVVARFAEASPSNGPQGIVRWYAYALIGKKNYTPIFGKRPPSRKRQLIPREEFPRCGLSHDVRSLVRFNEEDPRFIELEIRKSDFERRLEEIKRWTDE